jgi:integrase/recombinase XerC
MSVFKKSIVAYFTPESRKCKKSDAVEADSSSQNRLRTGYKRRRSKSNNYYGKYKDADGVLRCVPLCPDKKASEEILAKLTTDGAKGRHGLRDPYQQHRSLPVSDHLAAFEADMEVKGGTEDHRKQVIARLNKACKACGFERLEDLSGTRLGEWLSDRRRGGRNRTTLDINQELYTVREAATILQAKPPAMRAMISRHNLEAKGQGKARRYPRATIEALQDRLCRGISVQTSNYIITHAKAFGRFLVKSRRVAENPFAHVQKGRTEVDRRHDRRELTADEMTRLLTTTRASDRSYRGLSGLDRSALYTMAAATGLRAAALASLTPESFQLNKEQPMVVLAARFNKNRKPRVQPLPVNIVGMLQSFLAGKPPKKPTWGGTWARDHRGAEMIRKDLADAGIPYVVEGADGPLHADFHALRHTFITLLGRNGVDLRTSQELAGHGSPVQTARYSHRGIDDMAKAVQNLPRFLPEEEVRSDKTNNPDQKVSPRLAQTGDVSGQRGSGAVSERGPTSADPKTTQPLVSQGFGQRLSVSDIPVQERGRRDSNPQLPDRQSGTLTS